MEFIVVLLSAHFVADFLLQPDWLQCQKKKLWALSLHSGIVATLSYLFCQQWGGWLIPVLVFIFHGAIDLAKQQFADTWRLFCLDQGLHIASIVLTGWLLGGAIFDGLGMNWMILFAGFSISVQGAGFLIGKVASKIQAENNLGEALHGLKDGGKMIGQLERALIFLFVMTGQSAGIGFLVAAKSILRFGEAKDDQTLAEYVLVGTLLSFGLAISAAAVTKFALEWSVH